MAKKTRTLRTGSAITPEDIADNFADIAPPLSSAEAHAESSRCLYCYDAPCTQACPTHIDVPAFIKKIQHGNLKGAARVILEANPMGHSCARACPVDELCEGACVMHHQESPPIQIARLQRHATDAALAHRWRLFKPAEATGKKVAVIGAGPAGLSCAQELRRAGHDVVVFDARSRVGGLNTYGIAQYKLTSETALAEAQMVIDLGVEIRAGISVGTDVSFAQLEHEFDAIFLAVGLGATQSLGIPGEELPGVIDAITFIEHLKTTPYGAFRVPARVLVVGAGNTAVDAATQARRLGAEHVSLVYRRTEEEAPAYDYELDLARRDGVGFHWLTAPTRVVARESTVVGLECISMELGTADHSGRRAVHPVAGTEHVIPCDLVIKAVGQSKRAALLSQISGLALDAMGRVVVNSDGQTGNPRYFAGGDCINGGREIVNAAAEGRHAACAIHGYLSGG